MYLMDILVISRLTKVEQRNGCYFLTWNSQKP